MKTSSTLTTRQLVMAALFIALSFVGANLKIFGTIAFDSLPAFLAALVLGPMLGATIGFLGHMATALTSGFPLSPPLHLVIALAMGLTMFVFGWSYRFLKARQVPETFNHLLTGLVGVFLNAPVTLGLSILTLSAMAGWQAGLGLLSLLPVLSLAALVNVALALVLFIALQKVWQN